MSLDVAFRIWRSLECIEEKSLLFVHLFEAMDLESVYCTPQPRERLPPRLLLSSVFSINEKRPRNPRF